MGLMCSRVEKGQNMLITNSSFFVMFFLLAITKPRLFKYTENFSTQNWKLSDKKILIFSIFLLKT